MLIDEVMSPFPACVRLGTTVRRAAELLATSEVGMLMVLDPAEQFVGVLTETDLLAAVLPDGGEIREAGNTLENAFEVFVTKGRNVADRTIDQLVIHRAVTVARGVDVAVAAVALLDRGLRRLPVLEGSRVVGSVSRADLCRAVLAHATAEPAAPARNGTAAPAATQAAPTTPPRADVADLSGSATTVAAERLAAARAARAAATAGATRV